MDPAIRPDGIVPRGYPRGRFTGSIESNKYWGPVHGAEDSPLCDEICS